MKSYPIFVTLLVGILTGCSSISKFENRPRLGDAIVRYENPKAGGLAAGDAFVYIEGIDGAATGWERNDAAYHVQPGKHRLALFVSAGTSQQAQEYFYMEATADQKYRLRATRKGRDFIVALANDTNPGAIAVIATVEMKGTEAYRPPPVSN